MNIFVAAWYYPPVTSSEGIVTYKLLRKSKHHYDVFSSLSENWSYHTAFDSFEEPNIDTYTINTDEIDEWCEAAIAKFEELYPTQKYDCIMTRSTPPESILVGLRIKEKYPNVKWIASLADPVANNPYEIKAYIEDNPLLTKREKKIFKINLMQQSNYYLEPLKKRSENGIQLLCKLKEWESEVVNKADLVICPTERQLSYLNGDSGWQDNYFALPHSYCADFYPDKAEETSEKNDKIVFTYTGYSDEMRSLKPFIDAVTYLNRSGSPVADKILFKFIGNTPHSIKDLVLNFGLQDQIQILPSVSYFDSLQAMMESDWLLHVDARFEKLEPGGSIFFAGKIADYLGAGKPILALTGDRTPACRIIEKAGGLVVPPDDIIGIADTIENICIGNIEPKLNEIYQGFYDSVNVAARFDEKVNSLCDGGYKAHGEWHHAESASDEKLLTVCVPSYNVERCLDRCLYTLTSCKNAPYMDIIVVDDGSKDHTLDIAKEYEAQFPGIVRAVHKENGGHGSTINVAMDMAAGKYFRVVDSDDWVDSNELDRVMERMKNDGIDTDIISTNYHIVNLEKGTSAPIIQDFPVEYDKVLHLAEIDTKKAYFTMAGSMIKTSVLKQTGMKLQENTFYVDMEFILFPVPYIDTVMFIDAYIYKYSRGNKEQSVHIPNMVKRYDHHERVMKRIIEYRIAVTMNGAQEQYYDSILKRVMFTHYGLCAVYCDDKEEGFRRLKSFDAFMEKTSPEMYAWIGRALPVVKAARRRGYDYKKVKYSPGNILAISKGKTKQALVANSSRAKRLIQNRYTYKIAESDFFSKGKGFEIKNRIYKSMIE